MRPVGKRHTSKPGKNIRIIHLRICKLIRINGSKMIRWNGNGRSGCPKSFLKERKEKENNRRAEERVNPLSNSIILYHV